ncbi:MAG: ABC transporter ATP-binding protein [Acholeplasmataceae bacterium]
MNHISLKNVYKSYHKNEYVIKDLSLEIFEDEFLVFVGPSGCGKTTTLRMIAGLEEIDKGSLWIDDILQNDLDPSSRKLSFVFQNYALLPDLDVYGNISFGLLNEKMTVLEKKKRIEEVARKLNLYEKLGRYSFQLSGGERQRVALARALVDYESLVLFDEPLSNLDAVLREQMRSELIRLHKIFKMTAIYVTHDQIEAMAMATRIVYLDQGHIVQVGTPFQMYFNPVHLSVSTFIGSPDNNVIEFTADQNKVYVDENEVFLSNQIDALIKTNHLKHGYLTIRPNQISVFEENSPKLIEAEIISVENFGKNQLLHLDFFTKTLRVIVTKQYEMNQTVYIDLNADALCFNENKQRVYEESNEVIYIDHIPKTDENNHVIDALRNYGYQVVEQKENVTIQFNEKLNVYNYFMNDKTIELKVFKDILLHLSYIKKSPRKEG